MLTPRPSSTYFFIDQQKVSETTRLLCQRIEERFPDSGLIKTAIKVHEATVSVPERAGLLRRPYWPLRALSALLFAAVIALIFYVVGSAISWHSLGEGMDYREFIGVLAPALSSIFFITAYFLGVWGLERNWKQGRAFAALNELRSLAHVIDMHQLTKDPERTVFPGSDTASSPQRELSAFELSRYLDYCSELVSVIGKVSAFYAAAYPRSNVLTAVDQVEMLCTNLSRKIWQKMSVVNELAREKRED